MDKVTFKYIPIVKYILGEVFTSYYAEYGVSSLLTTAHDYRL